MIFGTDTSRYQTIGDYDPGAFEIVNVEEPDSFGGDFSATIARNVRDGRPWGVYLWVHPGRPVDVSAAVRRVRALGHGDGQLGYWLDYEEVGVAQWQIDDAFSQADALGVRCGLYTYLYLLPGVQTRGRHLWLAYYPGNNDGTYPEGQDRAARAAGAVLWQFTSGANAPTGLDRNVVVDEAWYSEWTSGVLHGGEAPPDATTTPPPEGDAMFIRWSLRDDLSGSGDEVGLGYTRDGVPYTPLDGDDPEPEMQRNMKLSEWRRLTGVRSRDVNIEAVVLAARQAIRLAPKGTTATKDAMEARVDDAVRAALA